MKSKITSIIEYDEIPPLENKQQTYPVTHING